MRPEKLATPDWPSIGKFRFWLDWSAPAAPRSFSYHFGYLALDKGQELPGPPGSLPGSTRWVECAEVTEIAELAWSACAAGKVLLVQRRFEPLWYEYIAVRAAPSTTPRKLERRRG